jgi:hypothetical protein
LLERSFNSLLGATFLEFHDYLSLDKMTLVKLHGSVVWGYPILNSSPGDPGSLIAEFDRLQENVKLDQNTFQRLWGYEDAHRLHDNRFFYPAIAIPA